MSGASPSVSTKSFVNSSGSPFRNESSRSMNSAARDNARKQSLADEDLHNYSFQCTFVIIELKNLFN